jgi:transglutaminase-like putative cysteine protease
MPRLALLLLCAALAGCDAPSADLERFRAQAGERHWRIELDGAVRGAVTETRTVDAAGRATIATHARLNLPGGGRLDRTETRRYAATPPHGLVERRIERIGPDGVRDARSEPGAADARLADALTAPSPAQGLVLGDDGRPAEYRIGEGFVLRRVDRAPVLPAPRPLRPLHLPVAGDPGPRGSVDALRVRLVGPAAALLAEGPGQALEREGADAVRLRLTRLAAPATGVPETLRAVLATVRETLDYVPGAAPADLAALLERREGDCWEFAALFDALARRSGLSTRLVTGLAWTDAAGGGFAPHAWNEVRVDDAWVSVDPTWGQIGADAARIRFPADPARQLDVQLALARSSVTLLAAMAD